MPWIRCSKPANWKVVTTNQFQFFGGSFFAHPLPWHTDQTQCQRNCQQRQHLGYILYTLSWGILWWSRKTIKYYATKKACISTLTRIIYMDMYNYCDANSEWYIFQQEPTKKTKKSIQMHVWKAVFGKLLRIQNIDLGWLHYVSPAVLYISNLHY